MTTITVPVTAAQDLVAVTPFDRVLLRAVAALETLVSARLTRRSSVEYRRALTVRIGAGETRRIAEALGAASLLPR